VRSVQQKREREKVEKILCVCAIPCTLFFLYSSAFRSDSKSFFLVVIAVAII